MRAPCAAAWLLASAIALSLSAPLALAAPPESQDSKNRPDKATAPEPKTEKAPEAKAPPAEARPPEAKPAKPKADAKRVEPRHDGDAAPKEPAKPKVAAKDDSPATSREAPSPKKDAAPKDAAKEPTAKDAAKEPAREPAAKEPAAKEPAAKEARELAAKEPAAKVAAKDAPVAKRGGDVKPSLAASEARSKESSPTDSPPKAAVPAKVEVESAPPVAPALGPRAGAGDRHVSAGEVEPPPESKPSKKAEKAERTSKGNETPAREPGTPDADARRAIAGGPTVDDLNATKNDPELRELSLAERALFPRPLRGVQAGWSFDAADDGAASVEATGLPPGFAVQQATPSKDATKEAEWLRLLSMPNLPTRLDARVVKYLKFYRDDPRGKSILRVWAKKCGRLVPALKVELAKAGLPTDLIWLSLIESGHNPTIVSAAGAAGLWQFVPESGRMYGLTVDRWVDERLDPERSTEAAIRYLSDLRTRFGSWELAMAAYNMGHGGLLRAVRKFNTNDFWALSRYEAGLPWETTLYVPKILATAIAMSNRKAFGIDDIVQDPALAFDTVFVGPNTDLGDVARAADSPLADVRELNAVYLSGRTPPAQGGARRWPVRVPAGHGLVAEQRLAATAHPSGTATEVHVVRFGDTLDSIALEYGTTARELAELNHVEADRVLAAGSVLLVGSVAKLSPRDAVEEEPVVVPARRFATADKSRVFYRVRPGDSLPDVATAFSVSPSELILWNGLDPSAELQQGMTLQVFVRPDADLSRVRHLAERDARVLVAGSEEFFEYFESQNGRKRFTVVVKKGDTLAAIGKRYGMSTSMMERINRAPSSRPLVPGEKIVVYSKQAGTSVDAAEPDLARQLSAIVAPMPDVLPPLAPPSTTANGLRAVAQ